MHQIMLFLAGLWVGSLLSGDTFAGEGTAQAREAVELRQREGLPNFFGKAHGTNKVRVAYFGGSITAAAGWRPQSLDWFRAQYPTATFEQINAAIGGTGSDLGVFRLGHDVLAHRPDLVFVEFAVNDGGAAPSRIHRCMEGIVRQIWGADPATDICFVYTLQDGMTNDLAAGRLPRSAAAMEQVADHYGIPSILVAFEAARRIRTGEWVFSAPKPEVPADPARGLPARPAFAPDGCHPFPETGHRLYTDALARSFKQMATLGQPAPHRLDPPITADHHAGARLIPIESRFLVGDWEKLDPASTALARAFGPRLSGLWQAERSGAAILFAFRGRWACIYDLLGPDGGELEISVDGRPPRRAQRFDAYCTYHRLGMLDLCSDADVTNHTVRVRLTDTAFDKVAILRRIGNTMDDPARFAPRRWQAGAILIDGDLIDPATTPGTHSAATPPNPLPTVQPRVKPDAIVYEGTCPGWPWVGQGSNPDENPIVDRSYPGPVRVNPHERLIVGYEIRPASRRIAAYRVLFPDGW
jgi:lysophospholipase L1-like esterase